MTIASKDSTVSMPVIACLFDDPVQFGFVISMIGMLRDFMNTHAVCVNLLGVNFFIFFSDISFGICIIHYFI